MTDHHQSRAVRLQSLALVLAAFITTGGAVTSAFIQTGWIGRPAADHVATSQTTAAISPLASFLGTIEPVGEQPVARLQSLAAPSIAAPIKVPMASAAPPGVLATAPLSKPLMATGQSWFPTVRTSAHAETPKSPPANSKSVDWGAIPRFLQGQ